MGTLDATSGHDKKNHHLLDAASPLHRLPPVTSGKQPHQTPLTHRLPLIHHLSQANHWLSECKSPVAKAPLEPSQSKSPTSNPPQTRVHICQPPRTEVESTLGLESSAAVPVGLMQAHPPQGPRGSGSTATMTASEPASQHGRDSQAEAQRIGTPRTPTQRYAAIHPCSRPNHQRQ